MCLRNILEKVWSRSNTWGNLSDLWGVLKRVSFCKAGTEPCHKKCAQGTLWKKCGAVPTPGGDLFDFCGVLAGMPFFKSGPETCHKKCVQGTFWKKWGAGPTPGKIYLIFVGSWKGSHFAAQAPKPVTRNVPREHFGKSVEQVQHLGGLI
jgi:hypothetical protein